MGRRLKESGGKTPEEEVWSLLPVASETGPKRRSDAALVRGQRTPFKRTFLIEWGGGHKQIPPCSQSGGPRKRRGNVLPEQAGREASAGGPPAQRWLTRTLACLCASASTASECWSPAGSLTSLLEERERGRWVRGTARSPGVSYRLAACTANSGCLTGCCP